MNFMLRSQRCCTLARRADLSGPREQIREEKGVLAPPSPFFKNVECVRETKILVEQQPPKGVFIYDRAGLEIN